MANEFYTLIVVPHAKAQFRKLQISARLARWGAYGLGAALALIAMLVVHYVYIRVEVADLSRLREENKALLAKTQENEQTAARLQARIQNLQNVVTKLGVMAGIEQVLPNPQIGGVGGVPSSEAVAPSREPSLDAMDHTIEDLTARSVRIEEFYHDQHLLLSSTPSTWPVRGYLSASFGNRNDPFTGQRDFHPGIDISTPIGSKVQAPADGVVVSCAPRGGYGNAIVIDHGYGIVTRYAHLDRFNVRPGLRVRRGDVIGFVGSTGKSTAPHLHYEVWVRDQAQNPIQYILDEYRSFG